MGAGAERRARLARARLMLLFTPELCASGAPLEVLARALPYLDVVQVRLKQPGLPTGPARASLEWTRAVIALVRAAESQALVLVNDRADVAKVLAREGLDGVHLGLEDAPAELARELLGEDPLIGLSTHGPADVAQAESLPVDYLGFGPLHATRTKGTTHGLGSDAAWLAARASSRPVFPIGGIDLENAGELAFVGRAAVSRAILAAEDPAEAARGLRELLAPDDAQR